MSNPRCPLRPINRRPGLLVLALLLLASAGARSRADAVDDLLSAEIEQRHLPGVAVAVVHEDRIIKTAAYGFADLELGVRATPKAVFQIQSITKTFTAAAILLLADEGKLSLEDPVAKHLDGTPDSWKEITIRHLLNHTSGIKDFINEPTASLRVDVTEAEVLRATVGRPLNFGPGERYAYSNSNYHLLAMIIRKLTGKWYGDFLRERVFVPLGMTDTRPVSLTEIIPNRASGYFWTGSEYRKGDFVAESILSYGGGGILSTAPDMALWAQAVMSGKLLTPEAITQAWTPARLKNGTPTSYGLGWGIGSVTGHREINHGGGHATGFTSFLALYPEDRLAVVVLLNRGAADAGRIAHRVAGIYLPIGAPSLDSRSTHMKTETDLKPAPFLPQPLSDNWSRCSGGTTVSGREAMLAGWRQHWVMFPDYRIRVDSMVQDGAIVAAFGMWSATYAGKRGPAPENAVSGRAVWRALVEAGRVKTWQVYADHAQTAAVIKRSEGPPTNAARNGGQPK